MTTSRKSGSPAESSANLRIGVLGGTFDPPHEAHLQMGRLGMERLDLDEVIFVPVFSPSHKEVATASFIDRLEMVRLLIRGEPGMRASDVEARLGPKSYTVPMLQELRQSLPEEARFFFLIGADSLAQFHLWYRYEQILELSTVVAFSRKGHELANDHMSPGELNRVHRIEDLDVPVASRDRRQGRPTPIPAAVAQYIESRGLYSPGD